MTKQITRPTNEQFDAMSRDEMVKFYNRIAGTKLVKFGSRSDGIKRIDAFFDKLEAEAADEALKPADLVSPARAKRIKAEKKIDPAAPAPKRPLTPLEEKAVKLKKEAISPLTVVKPKHAKRPITDEKITDAALKFATAEQKAGTGTTKIVRKTVFAFPELQRRDMLKIAAALDLSRNMTSTQFNWAKRDRAAGIEA